MCYNISCVLALTRRLRERNDAFYEFLNKITAFIWAYAVTNPGVNALRTPVFAEMINIVNGQPVTFSEFLFHTQQLQNAFNNYTFSNNRAITKSMLTWWAFQDPGQELLSLENVLEIEHIYARNRHEKEHTLSNPRHVEALGNKALLEKRINIRASDYRFSDKVKYYNMFEGKFGFPCQIEDDPIIKLVTYEDNSVPFAEERRLFYVALTRTKNRVYIVTPQNKPSRFLIELVKDYHLAHTDQLNMDVVDLFQIRCPVCGYPLKYEFNKNYGLNLWICTNEPEVCDFMTNDRIHKHDIKKCNMCKDGYLVVRVKGESVFYGCTNYRSEVQWTTDYPED